MVKSMAPRCAAQCAAQRPHSALHHNQPAARSALHHNQPAARRALHQNQPAARSALHQNQPAASAAQRSAAQRNDRPAHCITTSPPCAAHCITTSPSRLQRSAAQRSAAQRSAAQRSAAQRSASPTAHGPRTCSNLCCIHRFAFVWFVDLHGNKRAQNLAIGNAANQYKLGRYVDVIDTLLQLNNEFRPYYTTNGGYMSSNCWTLM
jgi:hypothetical protein